MGKNVEAIGCLDRVIVLEAASAFDTAVDAWTLAEVLRQGGGAEALADDLRFACTIAWNASDTAWLLEEFPQIVRIPTPRAPGSDTKTPAEIEVFEWLDRPIKPIGDQPALMAVPPVVLASVYVKGQTLRLSSPRVETLERIEELLFPRLETGGQSARREASPLPLPFLDADVWIFRIPPDLDQDHADQLSREAVERYLEDQWIHRPRKGLDGRSPLAAAATAHQGDAVARAKLTAVIRLREQLGNRASAVLLYQGYPFDRLRRRLGLELLYPAAVDPQDLGCASGEELDRLDPASLDDARLIDAFLSAAGLRADARSARFATELLNRGPAGLASVDLAGVVAPLVREAIGRNDIDGAVDWVKQAISITSRATTTTLNIWIAEIHARAGRPDEALETYMGLITRDHAGAAIALDAGEMMLDNGHTDEARILLLRAVEIARACGRGWIERRAKITLTSLP
jgi:tetratricopeptide (TPR) repeat protein